MNIYVTLNIMRCIEIMILTLDMEDLTIYLLLKQIIYETKIKININGRMV